MVEHWDVEDPATDMVDVSTTSEKVALATSAIYHPAYLPPSLLWTMVGKQVRERLQQHIAVTFSMSIPPKDHGQGRFDCQAPHYHRELLTSYPRHTQMMSME